MARISYTKPEPPEDTTVEYLEKVLRFMTQGKGSRGLWLRDLLLFPDLLILCGPFRNEAEAAFRFMMRVQLAIRAAFGDSDLAEAAHRLYGLSDRARGQSSPHRTAIAAEAMHMDEPWFLSDVADRIYHETAIALYVVLFTAADE